MHVEKKNICDNLLGTVLDIAGKTKNTDKAKIDLEDMNIRRALHLIESNGRCSKPPRAYVLNRVERRTFCRFLKSVRFPDSFASNLSRNVVEEQGKLYGRISHDCHILLQYILLIGIRLFLTKQI